MTYCPFCGQPVGYGTNVCQSCGASLPPGQSQMPPPPPDYQPRPVQPYPQQQYQPQYQPYPQPQPQGKLGAGSAVLMILGGLLGIVCSFMFFLSGNETNTEYTTLWECLDNWPSEFLYAALIPVFGLLAVILGIVGYTSQSKGAGTAAGVLGILLLILPIILAVHSAVEYDRPIADMFFWMSDVGSGSIAWRVYLGGFQSMFAGILVMIGGFSLAKKIRLSKGRPAPPTYNR